MNYSDEVYSEYLELCKYFQITPMEKNRNWLQDLYKLGTMKKSLKQDGE